MADSPAVRPGMGALPHETGTTFRVWAPFAKAVAVIGTFNDWKADAHPMSSEGNGHWYADLPAAKIGDGYKYQIESEHGTFKRIDPYAREVTNSVGHGVIHDPHFDWGTEDYYKSPRWNEMVIYELHTGTFNDPDPAGPAPGTFETVVSRFKHLKALGVNTLQVMPVAEFAGDRSWGYNPAHVFAVESAYGGPKAFKQFIKAAHDHGFAVILDVVYNHFGPSDLDLWRFDGWSENDGGGIYFYNDWRKETPWGATRPDYGRPEVRDFIRDNALMWVEDYRVDGLRMDMTLYIRSVRADGEPNLPDGWSLLQYVNGAVRGKHPNTITIAEDLQHTDAITKGAEDGGACFGSQWDDRFVHPIRAAVIEADDGNRDMNAVAAAIRHRFNGDAFQRVIYSESHDEVANGRARVPQEIDPDGADSWYAQKRSTLAAGLVFTAPGIPMLFQGQEFLEGGWFRDTVPVDWDRRDEFRGIVKLYRDLIHLRTNAKKQTAGLSGQNCQVTHIHDAMNMIAFRRWADGGPGDDCVIACNFQREPRENYTIGFPSAGTWTLRLNSDWHGYSGQFDNFASQDVIAVPGEYDGQPAHGTLGIGAYSVLIFSQDRR